MWIFFLFVHWLPNYTFNSDWSILVPSLQHIWKFYLWSTLLWHTVYLIWTIENCNRLFVKKIIEYTNPSVARYVGLLCYFDFSIQNFIFFPRTCFIVQNWSEIITIAYMNQLWSTFDIVQRKTNFAHQNPFIIRLRFVFLYFVCYRT